MNEIIGRASNTGMTAVEESANIAEIQAKMILARNFPRDMELCLKSILFECKNKALAEKATYEFPRGDSVVKGASIRLVECVARHYGNIVSGVKEISTSPDGRKATVKAYSWDLETNFADEKVFDVEYKRVTKNGSYPITDPRDKYEMLANMGARRKRACIQAIIPQYIIDTAVEACQVTLEEAIKKENQSKSIEEIRANMLTAFKGIADWISEADFETVCGRPFDTLSTKDIVRLRNLFNAIKDGFVKPETAFKKEEPKTMGDEKDAEALDSVNEMFAGTPFENKAE